MDEKIVKGFAQLTRDPELLLSEREKLGELLAKFTPIVAKTLKWDAGAMRLRRAAEVRIAQQTASRRKMLRRSTPMRACLANRATNRNQTQPTMLVTISPPRTLR